MEMDRREFVKFLALTAAGAAAMPTQVEAFEKYYDANTPFSFDMGLVAIDEIFIGGIATKSMPLTFKFSSAVECKLNLPMNAFGGVIRWVAAPDQKIVTLAQDFTWTINALGYHEDLGQFIEGHILYIDQEAVRHTHLLPGVGRLSIAGA